MNTNAFNGGNIHYNGQYNAQNHTTLSLNPCTISNGSTRSQTSSASAITPISHNNNNNLDFHQNNNQQRNHQHCNTANCNQLSLLSIYYPYIIYM